MQTHTFICGCGHSGTSLLANMFASHPDVFIPFEETCTFLDAATAADLWAALRTRAAASGRNHFAEKTPRHILHLDLIRKLVPGARFVVMVRDGRDVAASFVRRTGRANHGARRWTDDNTVTIAEQTHPDVHVLRYEDLIEAPETALRQVCAFSGLQWSETMLRFHETKRLWFGAEGLNPEPDGGDGKAHREHRNWQINQPIFDGRGTWKRVLSEEDLAFFERRRPKNLLAHFGYI